MTCASTNFSETLFLIIPSLLLRWRRKLKALKLS
jgi:hypothetical protein